MPKIKYKNWRPSSDIFAVVQQANTIIAELQEEGYTLTLRQLYYQFIGRGLFTENTEKQYKRLGRIVTDAREGGMMDWEAIEDRGRNCYFNDYNDDPLELLKRIEYGLGRDPWQDQEVYLECWIEKQSLEPVLARPCQKRRAPYMACKGYLSASEAYRAGLRFQRAISMGKRPVLIHLGDHDPSGMDMTRDNGERLAMFSQHGVEVRRVALNMDQVQQYNPPPMPSKTQDSRERNYRTLHGASSWELDALQPRIITKLILDAIDEHIDQAEWAASMEKERIMREESGLSFFAERYEELRQLATSSEKPLERLAAIDEALPELLKAADYMAKHAPDMITAASVRTITKAASDALEHDSSECQDDPVAQANTDGYRTARDQIVLSIQNLTPESPIDHPDKDAIASLALAAESIKEANVVVPFVFAKTMDEGPNDLDIIDPDVESQDYGLGPVKPR